MNEFSPLAHLGPHASFLTQGDISVAQPSFEDSCQHGEKVCRSSLDAFPGKRLTVCISELAAYHAVAPYQSQTCFATYLICGEVLPPQTRYSQGNTEDVDMESVMDEDLEYDDEEDTVPQTTFMLVNERHFESMCELAYVCSSSL